MKIAIYSRKSKFTGKGESIENQIKKCHDFIKFKFDIDPNNSEIFIDEGFSGKNEDRPQYQKMISKIKSKEIDSVIIYQLNRLGRNARDIHNTMQMCEDLGCIIYSATEGFDSSTSFGRAIIGILASLAQLEREQLAERVKDNMYTLAKMGRWLGGQSPLGFDGTREYYIDENGKERSVTKLKPNEEELKIVKDIYDKYLEEKSISQVAKWSLTNNLKGKNGGNIEKSAISVILQNPVYVKSNENIFKYLADNGYEVCGKANGNGLLRYAKGEENIAAIASHKGIISPDKWLQTQKIIKENADKAPAKGKSKTALLTGLLKCSCGSGMQVRYGRPRKDGSRPHYYLCTMKINSSGTRCDSKNINGNLLEDKLINYLKSYNTETLIKSLNDTFNESKKIEDGLNLNGIENEINKHQVSIKKLLNKLKIVDDNDVAKIILEEIKGIKNMIKDLESKKSSLLDKQSEIVITQSEILNIMSDLNTFNDTYDELTHEDKKKYLNDLLESIIYDHGVMHINFKVKKKSNI